MSCADVMAAIASQQVTNPFPCAIETAGDTVAGFATTIAALLASIRYPDSWPPDKTANIADGDTFDFIVVGGGTTGSVMAGRLSERNQSVLLIEAGPDPTLSNEIPALETASIGSKLDWQYKLEPTPDACLVMKNKQCLWPKGKVLGGCSSINSMYYVRGNFRDYDEWGIPGWSFEEVLPYFLRLEDFHDYDLLPTDSKPYHSTKGPVGVGSYNTSSVWSYLFLRAFEDMGVCENIDINGPDQLGVTKVYATIKDARRVSAARAYLVPASGRPNLHVIKEALATKVLIDENTKEAKGVEVTLSDGRTVNVIANKEVIVSCGTINSAKLLMLSGIGHKKHLHDIGIKTIVDLPVGDHVQDHMLAGRFYTANENVSMPTSFDTYTDLLSLYLATNTGPLGTIGGNDVMSFINTIDDGPEPDIQTLSYVVTRNDSWNIYAFLNNLANYPDYIINDVIEKNKNADIIIQIAVMIQPKSLGNIRLRNTDPKDPPRIYPGYLSDPADVESFLRGFRFMEKLKNTVTFRSQGATEFQLNFTDCDVNEFNSDDYWRCFFRYTATSDFHYHGSTGMGRVVDEVLRVYGVKRLRVADGSVFPKILRGNTNAACMMIGEKAVDILGKEYGF